MGYDPIQFLSQVDDEFLCSICTLVIENPVQTICEHLFCNECILNWLDVTEACPVDGRPLTTKDLSDPNRVLRNMLNKLEIKCDFEQLGCQTITKLENLGQHVKKCEYNLDGKVICDKGCNMTMGRREYQNENCFSHLAKEVTTLRHELSAQKSHFEHTIDRQTEEIRTLYDKINSEKIQTGKLVSQLSLQKSNFESTADSQAEENRKLCEENLKIRQRLEVVELCAEFSLREPPEWQQMCNMKNGQCNVLEVCQPHLNNLNFAQSAHALTRTRSTFKILVLSCPAYIGLSWIGLTRKGYFSDWLDDKKTRMQQLEDIHTRVDRDYHCLFEPELQNGDFIECGIEFPNDSHSTHVYISVNQKLISKETHDIPDNGFFPTLIFGSCVKIRYFQE